MGESAKASLFDVERLQQLSYERSTKWANFLDRIGVHDDGVINIDQLDNLYDDDTEEQDELASMEDEDCDDKGLYSDILRDITNSTRLALMLSTHNKTSTKLSESTIMQDENHELVDLFNQTAPVINEHNRQMKESGFDRILNTFDAKKIEEKVGGWLRRHNSLCTPDYMSLQHVNQIEKPCHVQYQTPACRPALVRPYRRYRNDDSDSDDSLHSGETARYIRSSRAGAIKNTSSTTMMIKTYRMVKSTRQALKDKYACAQDDDAEVHLKRLRHRRRIANEMEIVHSHEKHSVRPHKPKNKYITPSHTTQKRKVLRKRSPSKSCSAMDTSSESDNADCRRNVDKFFHLSHKCCGRRNKLARRPHTSVSSDVAASVKRSECRATRKTPCIRRDHLYYYEQSHSHSLSSSTSSLSPSPHTNRVRNFSITCRKNSRRYIECRPFRLESECRCCNEKRVCHEYTHLADSSTDEWIVENSYASKKIHNGTPLSEEILSNKWSISGITTIIDEEVPMTSTTSHKFDSTPTHVSGQPTKQKCSTKSSKKTKTELQKEELEDSFEMELQSALKASKELYEKEQKQKTTKNQVKINKKREYMPAKPVVKTPSKDPTAIPKKNLKTEKHETALKAIAEDNTGIVKTSSKYRMAIGKTDLKTELSENVLTTIDENREKSCERTDSEEDNTAFLKPNSNCNSLIKNRNATIGGSEDTFFGASIRVCNSTALPSDKHACQRQIDGHTELLHAHKTGSNKKRTSSQVAEVDRDKDTTKSFKNIQNIIENYTPVSVRTTKRSKQASTDTNPDTQTFNPKNDTPRQNNNRLTSTKLRKQSPNAEIMDNDEFVFAKPCERPTIIVNPKSGTKTGTEATYSSGSQVSKDATAVVNEKSEFEEQTVVKRNENCYNAKQNAAKSKKEKQENKLLHVSFKEEKYDANQENNAGNECAKSLTSLNEDTNTSIKSTLRIDKSIESDTNLKKAKIKRSMSNEDVENFEDGIFLKQPNVLLSEAHCRALSSTRVRHKDDSQKEVIDCIILDDTDNANNTDSVVKTQQNNCQSKKKNKDTKATTSRNNKSYNSNVSSTTIYSPDVSKNLLKTKKPRKRIIICNSSSLDSEDENDCTIVSSTTNIEPYIPPRDTHIPADTTTSSSTHNKTTKSMLQQQEASCLASSTQNHSSDHHSKKDILIYTPKNPSLAPAQSFSSDGCFFHITKEHLSNVIGEKPAEKFLKYYIGRRRFNTNSTIYFKPPSARVLDTDNASSSDSDDDLESMGQYGDIYESVEGAAGGKNKEHDNTTKRS